MEAKIKKQKEVLTKSKAKYETDKTEMFRLVKLRDSMQGKELMEAIAKNKYFIGDAIKIVKGRNKPDDED